VSASGQVTSTLATGTAPLVIASTTKVANLNVDQLDGADWASPGAIGGTTPAAGSFTTLSANSTATLAGVDAGKSSGGDYLNISGQTAGSGPLSVAYNQATNAYTPYTLDSTTFTWRSSGTPVLAATSTGLAVTGALSATLPVPSAGLAITANNTTDTGGDNTRYAALDFTVGSDVSTASIRMYRTNSASNYENALAFFTKSSGAGPTSPTEKMRLDSSGNLGLGVTPSGWASAGPFKAIQIGNSAAFYGRSDSTLGAYMSSNYYYNAGDKYIGTGNATLYIQGSGAHTWYTAPSGTAGNAISFTQAMTLDASGRLLVGQTGSGHAGVTGFALDVTNGGFYTTHATGVVTGTAFSTYGYDTTQIGSITQNGTTAVAYNTTSDHRLKENVRPANAARFMDIEFVDFEWVDGRHDCGVIADQLQSVYPDLVLGEKDATEVRTVEITPAIPEVKDEDGNVTQEAVPAVTEEQAFPVYQQVNYTGLIGRMGTRVQQLQRTVDTQAAIIAAMEARLSALEAA